MTTNELVLKPQLTLEDIIELTRTEGDAWKLSHVRRVLQLIGLIGAGTTYDETAVTIATYLHDWGAYPRFQQPGVEHALRSRQVAESLILPRMDLPETAVAVILETIEYHDYRDFRPVISTEAVLLREADFLDFLGIIGLVREYGRGPKDVESACRVVLKRREFIQDRLSLPIAPPMSQTPLARLAQCLEWLQEESFDFM